MDGRRTSRSNLDTNGGHVPRFIQPVVGIPERMDKLTRLMWPTVIAAGVSSVGGLVWFLRRRSAAGRHEMPDTPGAHEDGNVHVEPNGQLTRP